MKCPKNSPGKLVKMSYFAIKRAKRVLQMVQKSLKISHFQSLKLYFLFETLFIKMAHPNVAK